MPLDKQEVSAGQVVMTDTGKMLAEYNVNEAMVIYVKYMPSKKERLAELKAALKEEDEAVAAAKKRMNLAVPDP